MAKLRRRLVNATRAAELVDEREDHTSPSSLSTSTTAGARHRGRRRAAAPACRTRGGDAHQTHQLEPLLRS